MAVVVVLDLVSWLQCSVIRWKERLRNYLFLYWVVCEAINLKKSGDKLQCSQLFFDLHTLYKILLTGGTLQLYEVFVNNSYCVSLEA